MRVVLIFIATQLIALVLILEVGARAFDPLGISYFPETARLLDIMVLEEPIGYRLPENHVGHFNGVDVATNDFAMRDRPVAAEKEPGEFRMLMIGDSVMFSLGVEIEDSIPRQFEALANESAPPGVRYRTLNMGVPSYNTEQQIVQLEQLGLSLQPDAAILLFVINDLEDKMWVFDKRKSFLADFAQRSYAASLLFTLVRSNAQWAIEWLLPQPALSPALAGSTGEGRGNPRHDLALVQISKIHEILSQRGIPFLLLVHRNVTQPLAGRVHELGARQGFPVRKLDVWADPRWKNERPQDYWNSLTDSHCNPKGCTIHARKMLEAVLDVGLLDLRP